MEKTKEKDVWTKPKVESYVKKMINNTEIELTNQKEENASLKIEYYKLTKKFADLKSKEKMLSKALTEATQNSKDSFQMVSMRSSLEVAKIKQFAFKWINHFEDLETRFPCHSSKNIREEFESDVDEIIDTLYESTNFKNSNSEITIPVRKSSKIDVSKSDWILGETKRLQNKNVETISKDDEKRFNKIMSNIKDQMVHTEELKKPGENGFDINEAINPSDDLNKIIKDIIS